MVSLKAIIQTIETYINDSYTGVLHFDGTDMEPSGDWIHISVLPTSGINSSLSSNFDNVTLNKQGYVTATSYGDSKVTSMDELDKLSLLLVNKKLDVTVTSNATVGIQFRGYDIISQGNLENGTYFYKCLYQFKECS